MKHRKQSAQTLDKHMPKVLHIAFIAVLALFTTSGLAQSFNGFASYQDYLNNYYAQNQQQQSRTTTFTPTVQVTPSVNTNSFNGFASYQDYLNNYYANQNARTTTVDPCGYQGLLSLFVYGNNNCVPTTSTLRSLIVPYRNNIVTSDYYRFNSYDEFIQAVYGNNNTLGPRSGIPATSDYYRYGSYDEFMRAVYGNNYTLGPRSGTTPTSHFSGYNSYDEFIQAVYGNNNTLPPRSRIPATLPPTTNLSGFFEFSAGQTYQLNNGLIVTVQSINDNRCPLNVQCVWQGDIAATVRLEMGNDIRTVTVSMVEGNEAPQVVVNNASIQFVGLGQNTNSLNTYVSLN